MKAFVVTASSAKGGVGKSSFSAHLATMAAEAGYQVLVIDLDPRTGIDSDLGVDGTDVDDDGAGLFAALETMTIPPIVTEVGGRPNLDMIVGGKTMERVPELTDTWERLGLGPHEALARIVDALRDSYTLIVIDTAPGDSLLRDLAFAASDFVVVPTRSDKASIDGVLDLADAFEKAQRTNPKLTLAGVVLFGVTAGAKTITEQTRREVEEMLDGMAPVFTSVIRYQEKTAVEARKHGLCVQEYERSVVRSAKKFYEEGGREASKNVAWRASGLVRDYAQLMSEVMARLTALRQERALKEAIGHG